MSISQACVLIGEDDDTHSDRGYRAMRLKGCNETVACVCKTSPLLYSTQFILLFYCRYSGTSDAIRLL